MKGPLVKTNQRRYGSLTRPLFFLAASCAVVLGILPTPSLYADTTITTSQTQNGGVFTVNSPTLLVTHPTNNPLLKLTFGATTSGVNAVIVGNLNGDEGQLEINFGSVLTNNGIYSPITNTYYNQVGTYGSTAVYSGTGYLGLNMGSSGTATVSGANSKWINNQELRVGQSGTGALSIQNGGSVSSTFGFLGINSGSNGSATVSGINSKWTNSADLRIGNGGVGALFIQDGGSVSNIYGVIGYGSASNGTATISGANSSWTSTSELRVGSAGTGTLSIQDGGKVSSAGATIGLETGSHGTATISGANSTWTNSGQLLVGRQGTAQMSILNGGSVSSNFTSNIGSFYNANGSVNVSGANSTWTNNGPLYVGNLAKGTLSIEDGGKVSSADSYIAYHNGIIATATVSGANSTWTNSGELVVGRDGNGTLSILNGASVSNTTGHISFGPSPNSAVTVSGANSSWTNSQILYVGGTGTGTLSILDGGSVSNTIGYIALHSISNSTVTVSGTNSTWTNSQSLYIGGSAIRNIGVGTVSISNGGKVVVANTTKLWTSDTLNLDAGTLETGTLESDHSSGKIVLTGNNNQIRIGSNSTFIGGIQGTGGFIKTGPGTLTLNNANTYAGKTTVEEGTLDVQTALLNNGPASVSITATDDSLTGNPTLSRRRNANASYAGFGATFTGGLNTTAVLLAGTNLTGTDNAINMQVRQRTSADAGGLLVSDVLSLTSMVNNAAIDLHQTDLFVLQMSYNESMLGDNETALAATQRLYLVTFDENINQWVNAVSANIGGTPSYVGDTPWNSSYLTLGQFGVDTNSNTVWAVVNHNSQFAVTVPEPSTLVLGALASLGLAWLSLRRQRLL